ncbi:MAG TPA: type II toxin-antitoxin system RelE/ParE family toxin, partial [Thermomicrobiaceae bacterium]|nr:type II toxin-antitoxin system RelE/ParE family toxin [Thermomicrobiaceae bacterium]
MTGRKFEVRTSCAADRDLRKLRQWEDDVESILLGLGEDLYQGELLHGSMRGVRALHFSLRGSGEYRAAYLVLVDERVVLVFMIASRENFY